MTTEEREALTLAEFNKRLDASNARRQQELDQRQAEQERIELLLTQYKRAPDAIEAEQAA